MWKSNKQNDWLVKEPQKWLGSSKNLLPSDNELFAVDNLRWIVPTKPAAAGVNAEILWNGAKNVTSGPPAPGFPPPNRVSHSPVRSGTVSFSASLPSSEFAPWPGSSWTFSEEAVDMMRMGTTGLIICDVIVVVAVVVVEVEDWRGSESVGESRLAMTTPPGKLLDRRDPPFDSSLWCFLPNLRLSRFFFFFSPLPVRKPLACSSWNRDLALSVSTSRCCWLGTEDLRMASFCLSASL